MADDPTDPPADPAKGDPADPPADLGEAGKRALQTERARAKVAEKALADLQTQLKALEDKDKSDTEKLREQVATLTEQNTTAQSAALRAQIAIDKGLSAGQAKRLVGGTKEELEADADDLLANFGPKGGGATPPPSRQPRTNLRGGGDPTETPTETDPAKLAESVPRF